MRNAILAATALAAIPMAFAPLPALAQDASQDEQPKPALSELTNKMSDPAEQAKMAAMVGAMGEVLMELPVGPLLDAVAKMPGANVPNVDPDSTVRDLAGPDADRIPDQISEKIPMMMGVMSGLMQSLEAMRPALKEMAEQMEKRVNLPDRS